MASFSTEKFKDSNFKAFLENAEVNLNKINLDPETYILVSERLNKAKFSKQAIEKRREDLLMASILV